MKFIKRDAILHVGILKILGVLYINLLMLQIKNIGEIKRRQGF